MHINSIVYMFYNSATTRENWSSGFRTRSDTNQCEHSQKQARSLKFWIQVEEEFNTISVAKAKALISCAVTAQPCHVSYIDYFAIYP